MQDSGQEVHGVLAAGAAAAYGLALDGKVRTDSADGTHPFLDRLSRRGRWLSHSVKMTITDTIHQAVLKNPKKTWTPAYNAGGTQRPGAWAAKITDMPHLSTWPKLMRLIAGKERPHPGAQLRFTDVDGLRLTSHLNRAVNLPQPEKTAPRKHRVPVSTTPTRTHERSKREQKRKRIHQQHGNWNYRNRNKFTYPFPTPQKCSDRIQNLRESLPGIPVMSCEIYYQGPAMGRYGAGEIHQILNTDRILAE